MIILSGWFVCGAITLLLVYDRLLMNKLNDFQHVVTCFMTVLYGPISLVFFIWTLIKEYLMDR